MSEEFTQLENHMQGTNLALSAVAEVLAKMDERLTKEEEDERIDEEEKAIQAEKADLVKAVASEVVSMMKEGDLLVSISFTGRTAEIVETAKIAKKNGVKTIALTSEDSPLAKLSDVVLHIHTHLENNLHIPMTSRLAHLAIIDILSATVQARFGKVFDSRKDEVIKNIEKTRV